MPCSISNAAAPRFSKDRVPADKQSIDSRPKTKIECKLHHCQLYIAAQEFEDCEHVIRTQTFLLVRKKRNLKFGNSLHRGFIFHRQLTDASIAFKLRNATIGK